MLKITQAILITAGLVLATLPAHAGDSRATVKELKAIGEAASDSLGNGYWEVQKYDVEKFSIAKAVAAFKKHYSRDSFGDCKFTYVVGREKNLASMIEYQLNEDSDVDERLRALHDKKLLKTIVSAQWDGESGDAVACTIYHYEIYTEGGTRLTLDYELTD